MQRSPPTTDKTSSKHGTSMTTTTAESLASVELPRQPHHPTSSRLVERKIKRGFSRATANEDLVGETRTRVMEEIREAGVEAPYLGDTSDNTFILPDLTKHSADFRAFLEKELIEMSSLVSLEQTGRLNWWSDMGCLQRLQPLATSGDGNCLLHAASLGMWGVHDRLLILRHTLHHRLLSDAGPIYRRWRWQAAGEHRDQGFQLSDSEWSQEWAAVLGLSSISPKNSPVEPRPCCSRTGMLGATNRPTGLSGATKVDVPWSPTSTDGRNHLRPPSQSPSTKSNAHSPTAPIVSTPTNSSPKKIQQSHSSGHMTSSASVNSLSTSVTPAATPLTPPDTPDEQSFIRSRSPLPPLDIAITTSTAGGGTSEVYESLEQIHIFVLAQVIRRPIVVVADRMLRDVHGSPVQAIMIGGIYLPLLEPSELCHKDPLLFTYVNSHFSALVPVQQSTDKATTLPLAIPLVDPANFHLLPIHFSVDPGEHWKWGKDDEDHKKVKKLKVDEEDSRRLLNQYLHCSKIQLHGGSSSSLGESLGSSSSYEDGDENRLTGSTTLSPPPKPHAKSSVANKMGSLGRNIGKQLKKALKGPDSGTHSRERRRSISGVNTQCTTLALTWDRIGDNEHLFCALIRANPPPRFTEMIDNYLVSAEKRFQEHDILHRQRSKEILRRAEQRRLSLISATECSNPGCTMFGNSDTDRLCSMCYRELHNKPYPETAPGGAGSTALSADSQPCKTKKCLYFGHMDKQGFCPRCYGARPVCRTHGCSNKVVDLTGVRCDICQQKSSSSINLSASTSSLASNASTSSKKKGGKGHHSHTTNNNLAPPPTRV